MFLVIVGVCGLKVERGGWWVLGGWRFGFYFTGVGSYGRFGVEE